MKKLTIAMLVVALAGGLWTVVAKEHEDKAADKDKKAGAKLPLKGFKVAMLTGEGFQHEEAIMPLGYLTNRGAKVTVLGIQRGEVPSYSADVSLYIQKPVDKASPEQFDALVLPGGHAPEKIRKNEAVVAFAKKFYQSGKPVAAICHGPQVLITAGVVEDRQMTCYSGVAEELKSAGANYQDKEVVRDGNLVTSRLPKDIPAWLGEMEKMFVEAKKGKAK